MFSQQVPHHAEKMLLEMIDCYEARELKIPGHFLELLLCIKVL